DVVAKIAECDLTPPPPLAHEQVVGLASADKTIFVVMSLAHRGAANSSNAAKRTSKCLMIKPGAQRSRWALEVDSIDNLLGVQVARDQHAHVPDWPNSRRWLLEGRDRSGSDVLVLDVDALAAELELRSSRAKGAA